jgi:hypothetical protein
MPRRLSRSQSPILDPRAPPALPSRQHAISTLNGMSAAQIVFAVIGACVAAAGLVWTVTWAVRSWRKSGPEVVAEVGQGQVDDRGILRLHFRSGDSKIMRLNDRWDRRENVNEQLPRSPRKKRRGKKPQVTPTATKRIETPVNAIFVHNRGRSAVTVRRCFYYADLKVTGFEFEPQPSSSAWGDHLSKRLDQGEEIILVHEKVGMRVLWNAVMRDHGVKQCVYSVVLELGNGEQIFADPPILIGADMTDEEFEEALKKIGRLERREVLEPAPSTRSYSAGVTVTGGTGGTLCGVSG